MSSKGLRALDKSTIQQARTVLNTLLTVNLVSIHDWLALLPTTVAAAQAEDLRGLRSGEVWSSSITLYWSAWEQVHVKALESANCTLAKLATVAPKKPEVWEQSPDEFLELVAYDVHPQMCLVNNQCKPELPPSQARLAPDGKSQGSYTVEVLKEWYGGMDKWVKWLDKHLRYLDAKAAMFEAKM